jgi:hypothetical protein
MEKPYNGDECRVSEKVPFLLRDFWSKDLPRGAGELRFPMVLLPIKKGVGCQAQNCAPFCAPFKWKTVESLETMEIVETVETL